MYYNNQELFKVSASTGKTQIWFAMAVDGEVVSSYGQLGGKLQVDKYVAEPKNVGRSNETDKTTQATVELQAMYKDKITNGHYFESEVEAHKASEVCRIPRKVTNFKDKKHLYENTTMYTSTKFNGSRGCVVDGNLYSKIGRKEDIKVENLKYALDTLFSNYPDDTNFDAEVYAHGLSLQRIRSAFLKPVKTDKEVIKVAKDLAKKVGDSGSFNTVEDAVLFLGYNPNEDAHELSFYVFDVPDSEGLVFEERIHKMSLLEDEVDSLGLTNYFVFEYPVLTHSNEERLKLRNKVVDEGYEGLVHYLPNGVYEYGKRSTNTLKDKPRYDAEALVTGVEVCKNGEGKLLLKACDELGNVTFKGMMKGDHQSRMFEVQKGFIGQWVTFSYEELSKAGVPTKPTVYETRLCDDKGQPLE